ncbi:MAG: ribonuclease III [Ruminococcaceae bacterium]|nr:ribonuclease III [Oscillospiraceae bacterium]MBR3598068.1 ribonuclease III [Clostridia bacterium]
MKELEKKIGYTFRDKDLLRLALTHSSYANEKGKLRDNERLEFLGDSVLGFITAEYLFEALKDKPEGELTKLRANAVCEKSLAMFAGEIELGEYILLGKGEAMTGGKSRPSILSDAFESVIAAVYLDGGMEEAKKFVLRFVSKSTTDTKAATDYKTLLQEVIQKNPDEHLTYSLVAESGPDHNKTFTVEVYLNSNCIGTGSGHSKKKAEQEAAREALELMGIKA